MAQNVTVQGASYSDVPAVVLPKTGGGTATFTDTTIATNAAAAADIASGKLAYVNGTLITGTASGGGGASNVVTGTFKGTTTGAAMDITIPYTGSGHPINVLIYPSEGPNNSSGTFYNTLQQYATALFSATKCNPASIPTYSSSGEHNQMTDQVFSKSSSTRAYSLGRSGNSSEWVLSGAAATGSSATSVARFKDAKTLSVFIASTSYGFMANIEYTYYIIYSS